MTKKIYYLENFGTNLAPIVIPWELYLMKKARQTFKNSENCYNYALRTINFNQSSQKRTKLGRRLISEPWFTSIKYVSSKEKGRGIGRGVYLFLGCYSIIKVYKGGRAVWKSLNLSVRTLWMVPYWNAIKFRSCILLSSTFLQLNKIESIHINSQFKPTNFLFIVTRLEIYWLTF